MSFLVGRPRIAGARPKSSVRSSDGDCLRPWACRRADRFPL